MAYNPTPTFDSCIYQPGGTSAGDVFTTWAEVKTFIQASSNGKCIVYVDDSIVSPAPVDSATGITDCRGRVELRAAKNDSTNTSVLEIENGATLRDLSIIRGIELRCSTTSATPSLDFTSVDGGNLLIKDFGALSNAARALQPAITIAAGITLFLDMEEGSLILNASAPLFSIAATGLLQMWVLDASDLSGANPGFASGAGDVQLNYDNSSATFFGTVGFPDPPSLPGLTGTYTTTNVDNVWQSKPIDQATFDAPSGGNLPVYSSTDSKWRSLAMSGDATMDENGVVTVAGTGGPQVVSIPFTFATASPVLSLAVANGSIVTRAQISITTPFNDGTATLQFGTTATPNLVMTTSDSVPSSAADYPKNTFVTVPAASTLQLTITPGASTTGAGTLYFEVKV